MNHCFFCTLLLLINVAFLFIQQKPRKEVIYIKPRTLPMTEQQTPFYPQRPVNRMGNRMGNRMVGYLENDTGPLLPLYARPSPTHRHRYNYHTERDHSHHFSGLRLPVFHNKRDCTENLGCDELYDGSLVDVPGMETPLTVKLYSKDFW